MIYIYIIILSFVLTYIVRKIAIHKEILDIPNDRSSHDVATARGGGVAIVLAFYAGLLCFFHLGYIDHSLFDALLCAIPIAVIGIVDDIVDVSSGIRLSIQIICAVSALLLLGISWYIAIVAVVLVVWLTNLFNFLDGIDGYVGVETIFVAISAFLFFGSSVFLILGSSVAGFLPFNWQKASIFMGDVGSTFIGFVIGIWIVFYTQNIDDLLLWLLLTLPFWFDASYTLMRRLINGEKITQAHKKHLFQRAIQCGLSHQTVSLSLLGINLFLLASIWFFREDLTIVMLFFLLLFALLSYMIEKRVPFDVQKTV